MDSIWGVQYKEDISLRNIIFRGNSEQDKLITASFTLNKAFDVVFHATETIIKKCREYFEQTIQLKTNHAQDHNPHVALIISFLKLFDYVRNEGAKIPQRLLNFYYKDVLRIKEKDGIPDRSFVVFELVKGADAYEIKKGTKLSAGKDNQSKELVYETEKTLVVNSAQVDSLHTIFVNKNSNNEILNYYKEVIDPKAAQLALASNKIKELPKIFGEPKPDAVTEIGFAVASSQFYLAKGERNVVITFTSNDTIEPCAASVNAFDEFDTRIFKLILTGEKGWLNSDDTVSGININYLRKVSGTKIELSFTVSIKQEQAIIAFDSKLHPGVFNTAFPVLQFILKYPVNSKDKDIDELQSQTDQLCVLQKLQVSSVDIKVQVGNLQSKASFDGVKDLILENDETVLDSRKPFFPFTAIPKPGSSFYIGCKDLFYKNTKNFSINIEWVLPDNFRSYYKRYLPPYDSNKFIATLSLLVGKRWKKIALVSVIDVDTASPALRLIKVKQLDELKTETFPADEIPEFDNTKNDNTLRLKLNYPDFGHAIYPQLITSTVIEKANAKKKIDYYELVKEELHDTKLTLKHPKDLDAQSGPLKVIYDILSHVNNDEQAKIQISKVLSDILTKLIDTGSNAPASSNEISPETVKSIDKEEETGLVNDETIGNFFRGLINKFRKKKEIEYKDKNKQGLADVTQDIEDTVIKRADFIMPSQKELMGLIMNETHSAINTTVTNVADELLEAKKNKIPTPDEIIKIINEEIDKANDVLNDMIAKKISILFAANEVPPPPHTPLIKNISINYTAEKKLSAADDDKIFYVSPLGILETSLTSQSSKNTANYIFPKQLIDTSNKEWQGMLFIGIKNLKPRQNLSLLMQFAEGTKFSDKKPAAVSWFCSANNSWIQLEGDNIISDSTYALQTTGIIEFSFPAAANNKNSLFNTGSLLWLCAASEKETNEFPALIDVRSQAVTVVFKDFRNNPKHLALPLESGKIKTPVDNLPLIKTITQPIASFGGKVAEDDKEFYIRVSERLRHKSRAINNWDYERLVLEEFPSFYKVKCINNYHDGHFAVGHVTIVPIANLVNKDDSNNSILIPKTSYIELRNIENFLSGKSSSFVKIHAVNPRINYVFVRCKVKFCAGVDKGYYLKKLNDDLIDFLTPWATGDVDRVSFSAKVFASSIINFIDKQDYVDYVFDLEMYQYKEDERGVRTYVESPDFKSPEQKFFLSETELKEEDSILVSALQHEITLAE
jgi:hypothetical protein